MTTIRQQRVAGMLYQELSIMIAHELDDPGLSLVQVTDVEISRDLRNVKIYVSHDDEEVSKHEVLRALRRATPYLRRQIALRCTLRAVPDLVYHYDETPQKAARIDEILHQIAEEREEDGNVSAPENGPAPENSSAEGAASSKTTSAKAAPSASSGASSEPFNDSGAETNADSLA